MIVDWDTYLPAIIVVGLFLVCIIISSVLKGDKGTKKKGKQPITINDIYPSDSKSGAGTINKQEKAGPKVEFYTNPGTYEHRPYEDNGKKKKR